MIDDHTLPARPPASESPQSPTSPRRRILVVEDDTSIRHFNAGALMRSGYEVDAAEDGAAAWEALQSTSYDLLVTDNNMPKLSGVELLKKLRDEDMTLPVIMATGTLPTQELNRYPGLHPAATLLKPYTLAELLEAVKKVLLAANHARSPRKTSIQDAPSRPASPCP